MHPAPTPSGVTPTKAGVQNHESRALRHGSPPSRGWQRDVRIGRDTFHTLWSGTTKSFRPLIPFDIPPRIAHKPPMPKRPGTNPKYEFQFFDVVYEDGSQRSNRRVPSELLGGLDKDEPARGYIIEQDREIAEKSGRRPLAIKSISRTGEKKK